MSFEAKFNGICANKCGSPIEPGQLITFNDKDKVQHIDCAERPMGTVERMMITDDPRYSEPEIIPGKYGTCDNCHIELPATRVCGYC
jgi:hypothetical protein